MQSASKRRRRARPASPPSRPAPAAMPPGAAASAARAGRRASDVGVVVVGHQPQQAVQQRPLFVVAAGQPLPIQRQRAVNDQPETGLRLAARAAQPVCGEQPLAGGLPGVVAPQLAIHQPRHIAATSAHSASAPMARPCCCRRPKAVHSNPSENTLPLWVLMPPVARNIWFSQARPSGRSRASCCSAGKVASSRPRWIKRGSHTPMARALR